MTSGSVLSLMTPDDGSGNMNIFAQAVSNDETSPTSQSLVFRGLITQDTEMAVCLTADVDDRIKEKRF